MSDNPYSGLRERHIFLQRCQRGEDRLRRIISDSAAEATAAACTEPCLVKAELFERIGHDWWLEGLPARALSRKYGVHRRLVREALTRAEPGSRGAGLAMAFKLIEAAQDRWRAVNAPHLVALGRAGAVFRDGVLAERPEQAAA